MTFNPAAATVELDETLRIAREQMATEGITAGRYLNVRDLETGFRVYYNSGGAGHVGRPCPVSRMVWISAPGTTRSFVLPAQITSCRSVKVSVVRNGLPE